MKPPFVRSALLLAIACVFAFHGVSTPLRSNYFPRRSQRASADPFDPSLNRLRAVARVTNGIFLTRQLINGIDTAETDGIIAELLQMGQATPEQVTNYQADPLKTAINNITSLQQALDGSSDNVKKVEKNWKLMVEISKDLEDITDFKTWPDHQSYKNVVQNLKNKGVNVSVVNDVIQKINLLAGTFNQISINPMVLVSMQLYIEQLSDLFGNLSSTGFKFSDRGTAVELSSVPVKIANNINTTQRFHLPTRDVDMSMAANNLKNMFNVGQAFGQLTAQFDVLAELIGTRSRMGAARELKYTPGLPDGYADLVRFQTDVRNDWMVDIINSSRFDAAVSGLRVLDTPMGGFDAKIKPHAAKSDTIKNFQKQVDTLIALFAGSANGIAALTSLKSCSAQHVGDDITDIDTLNAASKGIDEGFQIIPTAIDSAVNKIREKDAVKQLGQLKTICSQAGQAAADMEALKDQAMPFNNTLMATLDEVSSILSTVQSQASLIKSNASNAFNVVDNIPANKGTF